MLDLDGVAIWCLVAIVAVDRVLGILRSRGIDLAKMARQVERLAELHAKTDEDGVPVWYVRRSLEQAIVSLHEAIRAQTDLLRELTREIRHLREHKGKHTNATD
jgi:hypothetical protein